jgi:hypothetical protein
MTFVFWTVLLLGLLLWLVRRVHRGLQELFFLLSGHQEITIYLFQIILLPGVFLHEFSHFLAAKLLGVRVRKVWFTPDLQGNSVQMGAVEMDQPDFLRGFLIGLAPLALGIAAIILIGHQIFDVSAVIEAARANDSGAMLQTIWDSFRVSDAWIWLYLLFAISNAMLPSEADRIFLAPTLALVVVIAALVGAAGLGPELIARLARPAETALGLLLVALGITIFVDAIFVGVILVLKELVSRVTGRRLVGKDVGD